MNGTDDLDREWAGYLLQQDAAKFAAVFLTEGVEAAEQYARSVDYAARLEQWKAMK